MQKVFHFGFIFAILIFIVGCTTPAYFGVPAQRFESPTVAGESLKGSVGGGYVSNVYVVTVKDVEASPPSSSGAEITTDPSTVLSLPPFSFIQNIDIDLRLGILDRFEVSANDGFTNIKYQFLGGPRIGGKPNEVVASFVLSSFRSSSKGESESSSYSYSVEANGTSGSLIVGYRKEKGIIYYGNLSYLKFDADTDIIQSSTSYNYSGKGNQSYFALGIRKEQEQGLYLALEWSYTKTEWEDLAAKEYGLIGGIAGASW